MKIFLCSSSVYSCHLFLISSTSVRSLLFHLDHLYMKCSLDISSFLEEISSLSCSVLFLYFFELFMEEQFKSLLSLLWNSAFSWVCLSLSPFPFTSLLSSAICKVSQTTSLPCISFSWQWFWSPSPVQCYEPPSIVLQALCLPDLIHWIYLSPPLYNPVGFDLSHIWMV